MALSFARRRASFEAAAEPNVIPLIDVLLVLLIIFMVTAPRPTTDIKLELPNRVAPAPVTIPPTFVNLRDGDTGVRIFVADREVSLDALAGAVLTDAMAVNAALTREDVLADARIYVRADDQGIPYGGVVAVLDELQNAGFSKVGVFAQTAEDHG